MEFRENNTPTVETVKSSNGPLLIFGQGPVIDKATGWLKEVEARLLMLISQRRQQD